MNEKGKENMQNRTDVSPIKTRLHGCHKKFAHEAQIRLKMKHFYSSYQIVKHKIVQEEKYNKVNALANTHKMIKTRKK